MPLPPSHKALVPFVGVENMMRLVHEIGVERMLAGLADRIEADARQITLFDSVGFAVEDFAALSYVRDQVIDNGLSTQLDLIADPDDPRDLYGMLQRAAA